ncbi:helix-turn-helix domain-containing protein [Methylosinus sp. KRF6]|uniref:winged helix-turn-helix domain-containing protein n=1 Tax=Methylosinus sp. KRF6 TaxID=2846853 RepID=UPI001C0B87E4|nr:helix-turn-helix domain-containing protein [Methylosinus sp. KRF6]MBU3887214.1 helix-turn-helix domain-containing protein [Methylosinus sp. KRF6]
MMALSPIETRIVARLRRARNRFVSRRKLAEAVYGDQGKVASLSSAVARLRRKGVSVEAKRGNGYRLAAAPPAGVPAPVASTATLRLPPTLSQTLGPTLVAGVRGLARRYALADIARRAVALVAGRGPCIGAIELVRRDGVYELPRR